MKGVRVGWAVVLFVLVSSACGGSPAKPLPRAPAPHTPPLLQAGVADVDITPPPGLSLFGHGPEARVAVGWRGRLRCKAFVFTKQKEALALVPCDLSSMSRLLQREVAARLARAGVPIAARRLFVMATHTHAGPAHYFAAGNYSGPFSGRRFGFDPAVVEWLADRIARGVKEAFGERVPARVAWAQRAVYGLTRNRSLQPLLGNRVLPEPVRSEIRSFVQKRASPASQQLASAPAKVSLARRAVDPTLTVLRVRRAADVSAGGEPSGPPLGVLAVFGMHPTAVSNRNDLYHADIFGYAYRFLERMLGGGTVVGIANGIEGDVSPAVDVRSQREARRLGEELARQIHAGLQAIDGAGPPPEDTRLEARYRELVLPGARHSGDEGGAFARLCDPPKLGTAAGGGAEDGPTSLRLWWAFNEGVTAPPNDSCHAQKLLLESVNLGAGDNDGAFPEVAAVGVVRLGDGMLVTLPAEVTTVAGLRMLDAVRQAAGADAPRHLALVGLTNGYLQYVTTADEYRYQHYEGASTLYGPGTARFFEEQLRCLVAVGPSARCRALGQPRPVDAVGPPPEPAGPEIHYLPDDTRDLPPRTARLLEVARVLDEGEAAFQVEWLGSPPGRARGRQRLRVEVHCTRDGQIVPCPGTSDSVRADDDEGSITVRHAGASEGGHRWRAVWTPPKRRPVQEASGDASVSGAFCHEHRFVVYDHHVRRSAAFVPRPRGGCQSRPMTEGAKP